MLNTECRTFYLSTERPVIILGEIYKGGGKIRHMKNILDNKLLVGFISFLVLVGFINALGIINFSSKSQGAQVFNSTVKNTKSLLYGVDGNDFGATYGIKFDRSQSITVRACGAGGGGGGGGKGWENGSDVGNGGAGGGGGGKGQCQVSTFKVRSGDKLKWNVGTGGSGGRPGHMLFVFEPEEDMIEDTSATPGGNGGFTYVNINGADVMQLEGGHGGAPGANGYTNGSVGGLGGSVTSSNAIWHKGQNGYFATQTPHACQNAGYGGWGVMVRPIVTTALLQMQVQEDNVFL